jgi:hypothetical protein
MRWSAIQAALGLGLLATVQAADRRGRQGEEQDCPADWVSFEVVTGYVYTAPADMLDSQPGTLMLTDCIDTCRGNSSCKSINYETGLCVLFSSSADEAAGQLTPSQFPVFTIYVQKNCLPSAASCDAAWSFDRVMDHELDTEVRLTSVLMVSVPLKSLTSSSFPRSASAGRWPRGRSVWRPAWRRGTSSAGRCRAAGDLGPGLGTM